MATKIDNVLAKLPEAMVTTDQDVIEGYLLDFRAKYHGVTRAVLRPKTTEEVSLCVRICREYKVQLIPQGGNTSYCGSATPDTSGNQLLLLFERLNKIREVDVNNRSVTAEAGVVLSNLQDAAENRDLLCPLALGSHQSCQIGGNISTNAGGVNVLRYGMSRDLVLGLEVVLPDGRILDTLSPLRKDNTGYSTDQLFIGAEGTLGLVTAVSLKLERKPNQIVTAFLACSSVDDLPVLFDRIQVMTGDAVCSFEYISDHSLDLLLISKPTHRHPLETSTEHYVLVEISTSSSFLPIEDAFQEVLEDFFANGLVLDGTIAASEGQRAALWELRESIPEGETLQGGSVKHDIAVRRSLVPDFITKAAAILTENGNGARLSIYGHVGDGNIHFNVLPATKNTDIDAVWIDMNLSPRIYELANEMGGTFSAEYGLGQAKLDLNDTYGNPIKTDVMRQMKMTFDPENLFNPGKVVIL